MLLVGAIDSFLDVCAHVRGLSPHTVTAYRQDLACFARRTSCELQSLTLNDLISHVMWLTRDRGLASASIQRHAASLRSFIRYAAEMKLCDPALATWRPLLKRPHRLPRPVSRSEMRTLVSPTFSRDHVVITAILLMAATGIRVGELCALRVNDVEPDGRSILVLGKGARERIVYVPNANLRDRLKRLMTCQTISASMIQNGNRPLFVNRNGPATAAALRRQIKSLAKRAGLVRPISPHMFRHSAATWLIEEGIDIRTVQRLLGHSSIATTEIYTHVADRLLEQSLRRVDILRRVTG